MLSTWFDKVVEKIYDKVRPEAQQTDTVDTLPAATIPPPPKGLYLENGDGTCEVKGKYVASGLLGSSWT